MDVATTLRVLASRRTLRRRERWPRSRLLAHQQRQLESLRSFAFDRSTFYGNFHRGLEAAPLAALPPLTKPVLMDNFDRVSTDPSVRLDQVDSYLAALTDNRRYLGRFWVSATSGSTGRRGVIVNDRREWATIIASYARATEWAGIRARLARPVRIAVVSSTTAWHQSSRVAATVRSALVRSNRLDAATPLPTIVDGLNELRPEVLVAYASMIRMLAGEQIAGRLSITPRAVNSSSEVLTAEARQLATRAWKVEPFNVYAATETGGIAAECSHHHGLHLFEDLVIPEVVDADYRPVPPGQTGDRLLVTVLFSRTLPLIRYELTDRIRISPEPCGCRLPFRLVDAVEGRTDDVIVLPGLIGGEVRIQPVLFHRVLDLIDAAGWQVRREPDRLRVLVVSPGPGVDLRVTGRAIAAALRDASAQPVPVDIAVVDAIPAGPTGKRPLVVAHAMPPQPGSTLDAR